MDLYYFGGRAIKLKVGSKAIIFDPASPGVKLNKIDQAGLSAVFYSDIVHQDSDKQDYPKEVVKITMPGEFEVTGFSVVARKTPPYNEVYGTISSNAYLVDMGLGNTIAYLPHSAKELDKEVVELLSGAKILVIPIGGMGLSVEPEDAVAAIKDIAPEFVVPIHYDDGKTSYESPQAQLAEFLRLVGQEPEVFNGKLSLKSLTTMSNGFRIIEIKP